MAGAAATAGAAMQASATNLAAATAESKPPIEAVATQTAEAAESAAPEARSQDSLAHHWMPPTDSAHKRIYIELHKNETTSISLSSKSL